MNQRVGKLVADRSQSSRTMPGAASCCKFTDGEICICAPSWDNRRVIGPDRESDEDYMRRYGSGNLVAFGLVFMTFSIFMICFLLWEPDINHGKVLIVGVALTGIGWYLAFSGLTSFLTYRGEGRHYGVRMRKRAERSEATKTEIADSLYAKSQIGSCIVCKGSLYIDDSIVSCPHCMGKAHRADLSE